jgi:hypothetical protein
MRRLGGSPSPTKRQVRHRATGLPLATGRGMVFPCAWGCVAAVLWCPSASGTTRPYELEGVACGDACTRRGASLAQRRGSWVASMPSMWFSFFSCLLSLGGGRKGLSGLGSRVRACVREGSVRWSAG